MVRTFLGRLESFDFRELTAVRDTHTASGREEIAHHGFAGDAMRFAHALDMRYAHQAFEITVHMSDREWGTETLRDAFLSTYEHHYGRADPDGDIEVVNVRTSVIGATRKPPVPRLAAGARKLEDAVIERRDAWCDEMPATVAVYERDRLPVDVAFEGPAIVKGDGATTVVTPGWAVRRDDAGNLKLKSIT